MLTGRLINHRSKYPVEKAKTCVLKVILLVLELLNNEPINHIETRDILGDSKEVKLNSYFFSRKKKEVCRLETIITAEKSKLEGITYRIASETLWTKSTDEVLVFNLLIYLGVFIRNE